MNTCRLCSSERVHVLPETHEDEGIKYQLYECALCHARFWEPFRNPGSLWYEKDERYAGRNSDPILEANEKHTSTIDFFEPFHGTVLDVGCGVGNFLAYAKNHGWTCAGIDFDRDAIEVAKRTFALSDVEVNDLSGYRKAHPDKKFDLVTFFDVFEHIDNHNEFIELVKGLLNEKGYLSLSVPYRGGWRWLMPYDLPPRHLTRWDIPTLTTFLQKHGFTVTYGKLLPVSVYFVIIKLRFRYGRFFTFGLVEKAKKKSAPVQVSLTDRTPRHSYKVRTIHFLAKMKDGLLFGIPALLIWSALLFTRKRNTDLVLIAQRSGGSEN